MTYWSGSPKPDVAPVIGLTKPILIVFAVLLRLRAQAAPAYAGAIAVPPTRTAPRLTSSRLVSPFVAVLPLSLPTTPPWLLIGGLDCESTPPLSEAARPASARAPPGSRARARG